MNKRLLHPISLILFMMAVAMPSMAQGPALSSADRQRWLSEIRGYKHDYLARELELTREQQQGFFPLYDAMEDEVERINSETRDIEQRAIENDDATDLEIENTARTVFEQKRAEGQIEMTYFEKFKEILTPRQLLRLKSAERRFTQQLVKQHRRMRHTK